jgi:hypothetical protein
MGDGVCKSYFHHSDPLTYFVSFIATGKYTPFPLQNESQHWKGPEPMIVALQKLIHIFEDLTSLQRKGPSKIPQASPDNQKKPPLS